ncbi:MAG TPA: hypothetical protein PLI13_00360, partial [Paracoccus sp. (in: a-proteobacteria)]|nr:hypothetical protein [Paracoccus sp. (in: a-proteobacteria)]
RKLIPNDNFIKKIPGKIVDRFGAAHQYRCRSQASHARYVMPTAGWQQKIHATTTTQGCYKGSSRNAVSSPDQRPVVGE